jgi:hypothetical protein
MMMRKLLRYSFVCALTLALLISAANLGTRKAEAVACPA